MGETGVFAAKRALCGRSDAIPQHATSPPDSNGEKNHRRPQETGAAKPKEICESILTLRAEFPAHSAITCPVRGLKNHFATRAFVEKRAGIPRARRRAGNNTCKCRSVTQIFNGADLFPKHSRAGKLKRRIPPRPMRAKRCNPATRDKPARLKWREKPPPPARNRRSKAKGNLRIHFNPARGISRAFRNNLPRKRLKKSLCYARLCREARRNPAGAPTRGQQHLQMPFRNPDFQRRRPFPQTFPRGQTETADSPAPIRANPQ